MTVSQQFFALAIWLLLVPPATAQVAIDISEERIFARWTAYIDARFQGRLPAYLVRCPRCLTHWCCFLAVPIWIPFWSSISTNWTINAMTAVVGAFAAARIAIKLWL